MSVASSRPIEAKNKNVRSHGNYSSTGQAPFFDVFREFVKNRG